MTYVVRDENKTIAKAAGWDLVSTSSRHGVFAHAATGRVVEISVPEGFNLLSALWGNLVDQLKEAGLTSGPKSV
jgi:hypothetical protein